MSPTTRPISYTAAKAGLNHLTRHLAKDLAPDHIHLNSISPGAFVSDMNVKARDEPEIFKDFVPAGRIGQPEDIGGTVVYMASRAGDYLVGVNLTLDGGVVFCARRITIPAPQAPRLRRHVLCR